MDAMVYGDISRNILLHHEFYTKWIPYPLNVLNRYDEIPSVIFLNLPPLYCLVNAIFFNFLGISFNTMKIMNIFFSSLSIILTFLICKWIDFKSDYVAFLACFLLGTNTLFIYHSIHPGNEILSVFFVLMMYLFWIKSTGTLGGILAGFLCGLAFLTRYENGIIAFFCILICGYYNLVSSPNSHLKRKNNSWIKNFVFVVGFIFILIPFFIYNNYIHDKGLILPLQTLNLDFISFDLTQILVLSIYAILFVITSSKILLCKFIDSRIIHLMQMGFYISTTISIILSCISGQLEFLSKYGRLFIIFAILGLFVSIRDKNRKQKFYFPIIYLSMTLLFYSLITLVFGKTMDVRYFISIFPFLSILSSFGIKALMQKFSNSVSRPFLISIIIVIVLTSSPLYATLTNSIGIKQGPFKPKNWDLAIDWIKENTSQNDTFLSIWPNPVFYADRRTIALHPLRIYVNNSELFTILREGNVSYLIIDQDAYYIFNNPLIKNLYEYPGNQRGFKLIFSAENPKILIYDTTFWTSNQSIYKPTRGGLETPKNRGKSKFS